MNIKSARRQLNMSLSEFAELHRVSTHAVRRWEQEPTHSGHRTPSGSAIAFTEALLAGYRPSGYRRLTPSNTKGLGT